ncbi:hypothetical protein [Kangiella sediminilitoris]|uniref:NAD/FAD-utilizing enzyme apparently involved in cell division n=1 Tax=Kangiella sediminilitoris TaxID=1144748 RepID=A0A1B3BA20_9GAMM|nr:hypothetical protein [Kangiella sediminilitoris]AOE49608.1 hypothetical protein KS2013_886 [Kangiella sediminilitoris]
MSRLLYEADHLAELENTYEDLRVSGVSDDHLHVIAKKQGRVLRRGLNAANNWYKTDILNGASKGAIIGFLVSIAMVIVFYATDAFSGSYGIFGVLATLAVFTGFGTWLGGFIGLQSRNHALKEFYHLVDEGKYLLLIDLTLAEESDIKELMSSRHPELTLLSDHAETTIPMKIMQRMH